MFNTTAWSQTRKTAENKEWNPSKVSQRRSRVWIFNKTELSNMILWEWRGQLTFSRYKGMHFKEFYLQTFLRSVLYLKVNSLMKKIRFSSFALTRPKGCILLSFEDMYNVCELIIRMWSCTFNWYYWLLSGLSRWTLAKCVWCAQLRLNVKIGGCFYWWVCH